MYELQSMAGSLSTMVLILALIAVGFGLVIKGVSQKTGNQIIRAGLYGVGGGVVLMIAQSSLSFLLDPSLWLPGVTCSVDYAHHLR